MEIYSNMVCRKKQQFIVKDVSMKREWKNKRMDSEIERSSLEVGLQAME